MLGSWIGRNPAGGRRGRRNRDGLVGRPRRRKRSAWNRDRDRPDGVVRARWRRTAREHGQASFRQRNRAARLQLEHRGARKGRGPDLGSARGRRRGPRYSCPGRAACWTVRRSPRHVDREHHDLAGAGLVAVERARRVIAIVAPEPYRITISAGICDTAITEDPAQLIRLADGALYWSKARGRDQCWVYDPAVVAELSAQERAERLERSQALLGLARPGARDRRQGSRYPPALRASRKLVGSLVTGRRLVCRAAPCC